MATSSHARALLGGLGADVKKAFGDILDYVFNNNLAFGPIDADDAQTRTTNFAGRYVKVTTHGTANTEAAIAHGLSRTPNVIWQVTSPRVVNSRFLGDLTISRAADDTRIYLKSASTGVTLWMYVE